MKKQPIQRIAVFCGSAKGSDEAIVKECILLAGFMHEKHIDLVYGGGNIGLMGILADEMLRLGSEVIGVIPQKLVECEVAHHGLTHLHVVEGMHERKALMAKLSDAFIILPGGIGTMEEFFEIFTWLQLGYHSKPVAILNLNGFYDMLIAFLRQLVDKGFMHESQLHRLMVSNKASEIIAKILE
jgi:uncharacterized protein (TIGR00730 family)